MASTSMSGRRPVNLPRDVPADVPSKQLGMLGDILPHAAETLGQNAPSYPFHGASLKPSRAARRRGLPDLRSDIDETAAHCREGSDRWREVCVVNADEPVFLRIHFAPLEASSHRATTARGTVTMQALLIPFRALGCLKSQTKRRPQTLHGEALTSAQGISRHGCLNPARADA